MHQGEVEDVDAELRKSVFATTSPRLKREFWQSRRDARRDASRLGFDCSAFVYALFSLLDLVVLPDVAIYTVTTRLVLCVALVSLVHHLHRRRISADLLDGVCAAGIVIGFLGWFVSSSFTDHREHLALYQIYGAVFMMGSNLFFAFRSSTAFVTSVAILSTVLLARWANAGASGVADTLYVVFYLTCFSLTVYVNFKTNAEHYRTFLNSHRAGILQRASEKARHELTVISRTDPLTRVANRRSIDEFLAARWEAWGRTDEAFAIALVDIDFFKKFNDWYGHIEGDRCLVAVAEVLASIAREKNGLVGRYGGEEFMLVVPVQATTNLSTLGDGICAAIMDAGIHHACRRDGVAVVTASVGVSSTGHRKVGSVEQLLNQADRALYMAKEKGRNQSSVFDASDAVRSDETEFVAGLLKLALQRELLSVAYQPIHGCRSGRIESVECLMRLRTLDGQLIPPSVFVPIAEQIGIIIPLGLWMIERVCLDVLKPNVTPSASVNVSAVQLGVPGFARDVSRILKETGVPGRRLAFEITEGLDLDLKSDILRTIADLKALGIRIWLDDFGTGFAGLSWLRQIEFDAVKIDKSFLEDIDLAEGRRMLTDIVSLVQNRGPQIIMEGIETEKHLDFASKGGVHQMQGYLLGRPAPLSALIA